MLLFLAGPVLYVSAVVEEEDAFVSVADEVVAHPELRATVAEAVTAATFDAIEFDEIVADALPAGARTFAVPLTRAASSQITAAAFSVLDTEIAETTRDSALRELHRQVTADSDEVVVDFRAVLVRTSREIGGPTIGAGVAKAVSGSAAGRFTIAEEGSSASAVLAVVRAIPAVGGIIALAAVLSLLAGILVAVALYAALGSDSLGAAVAEVVSGDFAQQQRGLIFNGLVLAAVGLVLGNRPSAVALRSLPGDLWHRRPGTLDAITAVARDNPPLARAMGWLAGVFSLLVWSRPTGRVTTSVIVVTVVAQLGIWLLTSAASRAVSLRRRLEVRPFADGCEPSPAALASSARLRVNVGILVVLAFLLWPGWSLALVIGFFAVLAVSQAVLDLPAARRYAQANDEPDEAPEPVRRRRVLIAVAAAAVAVAAGAALTIDSVDQVAASGECNGHVDLCDRRIDEVVFAGSHNAMSSTELGWDLAMQDGDIVAQLDHGIRALLIDALYWDETGRLDGGEDAAASAVIEAALSDDQPRPGTWLCHGYCALGATDFTSGLADIALWLDAHPREVLLIVLQDEVTTADVTAAVEASGLIDLVHDHRPGTPCPTLGELIDLDERVLLYAENEGSPDSWYQNAWQTALTETPFTFALRSDFSYTPNRGSDDNALFLLNHWLTTGIPVREIAEVINGREALLDRVRTCERERGRLPTVLAVDFVETGDLIAVVDELNGVSG